MYIFVFYLLIIFVHIYLVSRLFKKLKQDKSLWLLIIFNVSIVFWVFFLWFVLSSDDRDVVLWLVRMTFVSTSITVSSFFIFLHYSINKKFGILTYALILFTPALIALSLSDYLVKDVVVQHSLGHVPVIFGDLVFVFILYFVFAIVSTFYFFYQKKGKMRGLEFLRFKYLVLGVAIGGSAGLLTNIIIPFFTGSSETAASGPIAISGISLFTTYSYLENRLFGVKFILSQILYYLFLALLPFLFALFLLSSQDILLNFGDRVDFILLLLLISFLFGIFFLKTREFLGQTVLSFLTFRDFDPNLEKEKFTKEIGLMLDVDKIGDKAISTFSQLFDLDHLGIILFEEDLSATKYEYVKNIKCSKLPIKNLAEILYNKESPFYTSALAKSELMELNDEEKNKDLEKVLEYMEDENLEIIFPLNRKVELDGIILLGARSDGRPYTVEEISFLESLVLALSVSFGRAILHEEVQEFTKTLQKKVDEQTKEIREKMENMEKMRQREKDLLDIMGHELRTPLAIARNSLELIERYKQKQKKKGKKVKWNADFDKQFDYIRSSIRREMGIVETLLSATKLDAKKIETHITEVDLIKIIETTLLGFEQEAAHKGLKVKLDVDKRKQWVVKADSLQIQQVLDNFFSNAVKYTNKGFVKISLKDLGDKISVSVIDTGEGMQEKDVKKLGTKFFRLNQYAFGKGKDSNGLVRPGGAGLGLYVAFGLIKQMKGTYNIESKPNKGSTFEFILEKA